MVNILKVYISDIDHEEYALGYPVVGIIARNSERKYFPGFPLETGQVRSEVYSFFISHRTGEMMSSGKQIGEHQLDFCEGTEAFPSQRKARELRIRANLFETVYQGKFASTLARSH